MAARNTSIACGLGKVARQAMTTLRTGTGSVKWRNNSKGSCWGHDAAADAGTIDIPAPLATM